MDPDLWGPHAWYLIESCVIHLDNDDINARTKFAEFMENLQFLLPCGSCKVNLREYMLKNPVPTDTKEHIVNWVIDLHNDVRKRSRRSQFSREDVIGFYTGSLDKSYVLAVLVVVIGIIILNLD